jgi:release factor glutamine methyltransferase
VHPVEIYVGAAARPGTPTRLQFWRRRASGWLKRLARPYTMWWMSKERVTRLQGLRIAVPVGVFPPRLFFSTKLVCRTVADLDLAGKTFVEVGCGSGAISMVAARGGASVTALDISDVACRATRHNAAANGLSVEVVESDLFAAVDGSFDIVVITPPFFRHDPSTTLDHSFHAGSDFQYFRRLFADLGQHLHGGSVCLLGLVEGCDAEIGRIAADSGYTFVLHRRRMELLQWVYVVRVEHTMPSSAVHRNRRTLPG